MFPAEVQMAAAAALTSLVEDEASAGEVLANRRGEMYTLLRTFQLASDLVRDRMAQLVAVLCAHVRNLPEGEGAEGYKYAADVRAALREVAPRLRSGSGRNALAAAMMGFPLADFVPEVRPPPPPPTPPLPPPPLPTTKYLWDALGRPEMEVM